MDKAQFKTKKDVSEYVKKLRGEGVEKASDINLRGSFVSIYTALEKTGLLPDAESTKPTAQQGAHAAGSKKAKKADGDKKASTTGDKKASAAEAKKADGDKKEAIPTRDVVLEKLQTLRERDPTLVKGIRKNMKPETIYNKLKERNLWTSDEDKDYEDQEEEDKDENDESEEDEDKAEEDEAEEDEDEEDEAEEDEAEEDEDEAEEDEDEEDEDEDQGALPSEEAILERLQSLRKRDPTLVKGIRKNMKPETIYNKLKERELWEEKVNKKDIEVLGGFYAEFLQDAELKDALSDLEELERLLDEKGVLEHYKAHDVEWLKNTCRQEKLSCRRGARVEMYIELVQNNHIRPEGLTLPQKKPTEKKPVVQEHKPPRFFALPPMVVNDIFQKNAMALDKPVVSDMFSGDSKEPEVAFKAPEKREAPPKQLSSFSGPLVADSILAKLLETRDDSEALLARSELVLGAEYDR